MNDLYNFFKKNGKITPLSGKMSERVNWKSGLIEPKFNIKSLFRSPNLP